MAADPVTVEKYAIGQSVRRLEDPRLIQGLGRYSDDVTLRRCVETSQHTFRFSCPICLMLAVKDAGSGAVTLLLRAGVRVEHWNLPLELRERPEPHYTEN